MSLLFFVIRVAKRFVTLGIVLIAMAAVGAVTMVGIAPRAAEIVSARESTAADLELSTLEVRSTMFAADGSFLSLLTEEVNRKPIPLEEVPQEVVDSILAIEDSDFYEHGGVNYRATVRALVENVNAGGIAQGGSTITQQLVKNAILTPDQSFNRKSTEAFYALRLEEQMTKDEILERYLNTVYFGSGAYGVQAAAETYWGYESASELGWPEAALLAGIIRLPGRYDPTLNPDEARLRRSTVLRRLVTLGHITEEEAERYELAPLPAERQEPFARKPTDYFVQEALEQLLNSDAYLGDDPAIRRKAVYQGGLRIFTTFDPEAQAAALRSRDELLPDISQDCFTSQRENNDPEGNCVVEFTVAVASLDSHTGAVRALVGGPEFQSKKFNLATQGKRQPGSSMKTIVLAALFESGFTPEDIVSTRRNCSFENPTGFPNPYIVDKGSGGGGPETVAAATRKSSNCAFVRLGIVVGIEKVIEVANRLGIDTSEMRPELSLPLGVYEVTPMDMAGAYATFANDGVYNEPYYIERIEDQDGNVVYQRRPNASRAVSTQTARMIAEVMESNIDRGTGRRATIDGHFAGGKTGTTQNYWDAWFVGFSDYYTTAVWVGDPVRSTRIEFPRYWERGWGSGGRGGYGSQLPAEIWGQYMTEIHEGLAPQPFSPPEPYRGGRRLEAPDEIRFCTPEDAGNAAQGTIWVDSNKDGERDCYQAVNTGGAPPPGAPPGPTAPVPDGGGGAPPSTPASPTPTTPVSSIAPPPTPVPTVPPEPPASTAGQ